MDAYAIPVYLFLGFLICGIEFSRPKFHSKVDFLRPVSLLYLVAFSITPVLVQSLGFTDSIRSSYMPWRVPNEWPFFFGAIVSTIGYVAIVVGVYWKEIASSRKQLSGVSIRRSCASPPSVVGTEKLILAGLGFMLAGAAVMWVYASSLGGFAAMLQYSALIRAGARPFGFWAFLKPLMALMAVSSFFLFSAWSTASSKGLRWTSALLFLPACCGSILALYHIAARQTVIAYIFTFIMAQVIASERWNVLSMCGGMTVFVIVVVFGKTAFFWFYYPEALTYQVEFMAENWYKEIPELFLGELSFAFMATANAVAAVPWQSDFRWFLDLLWGVLYNIPDSLLPSVELPTNINEINTSLMRGGGKGGTVPLGLDALGYFSFGAAGTVMVCFLFGFVLRTLEGILAVNATAEVTVFRAATMMYMALRVTYADPVFALRDGFALFVGIVVFLAIQRSGVDRPENRAAGHRQRQVSQ